MESRKECTNYNLSFPFYFFNLKFHSLSLPSFLYCFQQITTSPWHYLKVARPFVMSNLLEESQLSHILSDQSLCFAQTYMQFIIV